MFATGRMIGVRRPAEASALASIALVSLVLAAGGAAAARPAISLHNDALLGVSCARASACTAVGGYAKTPTMVATLAEDWNGSAWKGHTTPNPRTAKNSDLVAISCPALGTCMAVGSSFAKLAPSKDLVEVFSHGKWHLAQFANPFKAQSSSLSDVSCWKAARCMAIGFFINRSGMGVPLAEVWTGTKFRALRPPVPNGATSAYLTGVHCGTASNCMAAGYYVRPSSANAPLAEAWNGRHWHLLTVPLPAGATAGTLEDVACPEMTCFAVGMYSTAALTLPLAEIWRAGKWHVMKVPSPAGAVSELLGIDCRSASDCVSVGQADVSVSMAVAVVEKLTGSSWHLVTVPQPAGKAAGLAEVFCARPNRCIAVGTYVGFSGNELALAEAWNGGSWKILKTVDR